MRSPYRLYFGFKLVICGIATKILMTLLISVMQAHAKFYEWDIKKVQRILTKLLKDNKLSMYCAAAAATSTMPELSCM